MPHAVTIARSVESGQISVNLRIAAAELGERFMEITDSRSGSDSDYGSVISVQSVARGCNEQNARGRLRSEFGAD